VKLAENGAAALEIVRQGEQPIDLLLTDVIMPGMSGRELADAACALRPGLKVLYCSGYSEDAIVHQGRLDPGVQLLAKPFRRGELARRVREVLDAG
jgi:CheY-like chemotaxis protein